MDEQRLFRFLEDTQPEEMAKLGVRDSYLKRSQFLDRLRGEIAKRGVIDVLRSGIKAYPAKLIMFYMAPSEKNPEAKELLLQFKRCMVHFAVDDARIKFCTKLDGKKSWFLLFDKGYSDHKWLYYTIFSCPTLT